MAGMAQGTCEIASKAGAPCDEAALRKQIEQLNVLPDLIRMQCSMAGAWGNATAGSLVQLRTLDFGGGPFANHSLLVVHHPTSAGGNDAPSPFASLSFPAFVGIVTGLSPHVALSEKVNDLHGGGSPPGAYDGKATA